MQEDDKFKISLGDRVRPLVQTKQNKPSMACCCWSQGSEDVLTGGESDIDHQRGGEISKKILVIMTPHKDGKDRPKT